ncbi:MAG: tetratricopeptide repeat protein [Planctomycetota bacterium]
MRTSTLILAAAATFGLAAPVRAQDKNTDKIYLTDGSVMKDVGIVNDGIQEVEYRSGRSKSTVPSERVLRIEYGAKPKTVDLADSDADQDEYIDAVAEMGNYLSETEKKPDKKFPWAAAYARYRLVELNGILGNIEGLGKAADELISKHPDSRYAPLAFVAKAQAMLDAGNAGGAKAAAEAFGRFVQDKGLIGRWPVEQRLWAALASGNTGKKLQEALMGVSTDAAEYPSVRNRAEVSIAESLYGGKDFAGAEKIFNAIVKEAKADARTMAAAWTGLGDCLYTKAGAAPDDQKVAQLRDSLKAYLRTVVVYPDESLYVAKAAFQAGRCYQEIARAGNDTEATDRAKRLFSFVITNFPGSKWEREARDFYGRT